MRCALLSKKCACNLNCHFTMFIILTGRNLLMVLNVHHLHLQNCWVNLSKQNRKVLLLECSADRSKHFHRVFLDATSITPSYFLLRTMHVYHPSILSIQSFHTFFTSILSTHPPTHPFIHSFIHSFIHPSIHPSMCVNEWVGGWMCG